MSDKQVMKWNVCSWIFATCLSAIFLAEDMLGPYKGLYCCVKESHYRAYAVAPILIVTGMSAGSMIYCYLHSYIVIKVAEGIRAASSSGKKLPTATM